MKFGETLNRRSVPQWRTYNIDYAQIKHIIKVNTTPGNGTALTIPGCGDELGRKFEDDLFRLFQAECNRVSLFVRSKQYELDSRLGSIERQLDAVSQRAPSSPNPQKTLRLRQRYSKIESDILSVGEEIQKLSRFTSTNKTAVRKLLKKHRKWSRISTLAPRVEGEVLTVGDSFSKAQLQPSLERYENCLERVRAPFTPPDTSYGTPISSTDRTAGVAGSTLAQQRIDGTGLDGTIKAGRQDTHSFCSVYWVHRDNVTELKVLLLQHTRATRRLSLPHAIEGKADNEHLEGSPTKAPAQTRECTVVTSNAAIDGVPTIPQGSNGEIRSFWKRSNAVSIKMEADDESERGYRPKKMMPGQIIPSASTDDGTQSDLTLDNIWEGRQGLPVVQIDSVTSRYEGLENTREDGHWVKLDEDIRFSKLCPQQKLTIGRSDICDVMPRRDVRTIPHAVLTVQSIGDATAAMTTALDKSYLTERVDGFSIESHAMIALYGAENTAKPYWFTRLTQDIRHLPTNIEPQDRRASRFERESSASSTLQGTPHASSNDNATPTQDKVRFAAQHKGGAAKKSKRTMQLPQQHYWNEFDHPESESGDFMVYIDPNAPLFPGQETLARWYGNIKSRFSGRKAPKHSRSPSINSVSTTSSDDEADDERSRFREPGRKPLLKHHQHGYGSLPYHRQDVEADADHFSCLPAPQMSTLLLLASILILIITSFLTITSRKKLRGEVDFVVVIGVIASLCFMVIAGIRWWTVELRARGNLINNFDFGPRRKKTMRQLLRSAIRRTGDVMTVLGIVLVCVGSALLLMFALK